MLNDIRLSGMSREQASREGLRLLNRAAKTGNWHAILGDLIELRAIMRRQLTK